MGDHDSLFKRAFSVPAHAAGELRSVLPPAIVEQLDLDRLSLVPGSFVDAEMQERHTDLLFRAPLGQGRGHCCLYLLLEHQSTADPLMAFRVLAYQCRIWDAVRRAEPDRKSLPPIVTVVVYHGEKAWSEASRFHDLVEGLDLVPELRPLVPGFELLIDDLPEQTDGSLQHRPLSPLPKVALWLLRDGRDVQVFLDHLASWAAELTELVRADGRGSDVSVVMRYILRVAGEVPFEIIREQVVETAPATEDAMASAAEQLIQRGIEKGEALGRQKGKEEGRIQTLRDTLARQLRARFGAYDASVQARIDEAAPEDLDGWIERVVTANALDEVFAP